MAAAVAEPRFTAILTGLFAVSSAALACLGVFGVMAYAVSVRREELAVRLALGATPAALRRRVLRDAASLALAGGACGLGAAVWVLLPLRAMLYGVSPVDPPTLVTSVAAIALVAMLAAAAPAWRASATDPIIVLRG